MAAGREKRNSLPVIIICVLVASIYTNKCGDRIWKWTNHWYSFHPERKSRDEASSVCRKEGGYLVVLNSKEEEDFIAKNLLRNENLFVDNVAFDYLKHEEETQSEARIQIQREFCKHYLNGSLQESPLKILSQNEIPVGSPGRALLTTPAGFSVQPSQIPRAGWGAWSVEFVPRHTVLGEYEGDAVESPEDFTYCWQVESAHRPRYVDGGNEDRSNWLRYVNCARNRREENTDTFTCGGGGSKFYYTTRDVLPDSELLVWYGAAYGRWLGIERNNPGLDFPRESLNVRIGSIYNLKDKWWIHSDHTNVTYTNWSRDQRITTRDRLVGLILTNRQTEWQWITERDYSYYLKDHSLELPFLCEGADGSVLS